MYAPIPAPMRRGIDDYINIWACVQWDMITVRDSRSLAPHLAMAYNIPSPSTHYVLNRPRHIRQSERLYIEFKTRTLTSLRIPMIVDHYSNVEPEMVLKCIILGNASGWASYELAYGHYGRHKEAFKL